MIVRLSARPQAASVLLLLALASPLHAEPIIWQMSTDYPKNSMSGAGIERFATELTRSSGGRIALAPSFDGRIGFKGIALLREIEEGRLVAGDSFGGALGEMEPLFLLSSLPFLAASLEDALCLYDAARIPYTATLARHRLRPLYATPWPPTGLWAKKPLREPDDLKGLAVRTYDRTSTEVFKSLGAEAMDIAMVDVPARLRDGSIQAVLSSGDGGVGRRLWDYLPAFTAATYAVPLSFATINIDSFAGLASDLQQAVDRAAAATEAAQWQMVRHRLEANYAQMSANGVTIATDVAPGLRRKMAEAARTAIDGWVRRVGGDAAGILAACRTAP